jgi:DNA ligase-1
MTLPIIYKKTNTGAIQYWKITVVNNLVNTEFGQLGTSKPITTSDTIFGKNIGKKNETTDFEQANLKAKQLWDKKIKEGYLENIDLVKNGISLLESIDPMLAADFTKKKKEIEKVFKNCNPVIVQPKLDGFRCIAIYKNGIVTLYSRTRKKISTVPLINEQLLELINKFLNKDLEYIFDGELYNHIFKDDFNKLCSIIKRDEIHENHNMVQYHIYDYIDFKIVNSERIQFLNKIAKFIKEEHHYINNIKIVSSSISLSFEDIDAKLEIALNKGYEGVMIRVPSGLYESKRSNNLLKYKNFIDEEFLIVDSVEGNGKLQGHIGSFVCKTNDGKLFNVKMDGKLDTLRELFLIRDQLVNKYITVKFFQYTNDGVPRFPVGKAIHDL